MVNWHLPNKITRQWRSAPAASGDSEDSGAERSEVELLPERDSKDY